MSGWQDNRRKLSPFSDVSRDDGDELYCPSASPSSLTYSSDEDSPDHSISGDAYNITAAVIDW
jgi:hypothetical protein